MPESFFTVQQVAERIGVTDTTVRNWTKRYAAHLSEHAAPSTGTERQFTMHDVNVLQFVASNIAEKRSHADIEHNLASTSFPETVVEALETDSRSNTSNEGAIVAPAPSSTVSLPVNVTELIVSRLDNVSDRLSTLEARRTAVQWFALGAVAGGALIVAGLLLAWLLLR